MVENLTTADNPGQPKSNLRLSVSIVTYHCDMELLAKTLDSLNASIALCRQHQLGACRIFIVSNDEDPYWISLVGTFFSEQMSRLPECTDIELIKGHGNVGFSAGHNLAIDRVDSDYHLVLNPDVILEPNCIEECLMFMLANEDAVMNVPQGFDSEGNYVCLAKRKPDPLVLLLRGLTITPKNPWLRARMDRYIYKDHLPADQPFAVDHASGCYMFCRTKALQAINGFDTGYFLYFEDYDLSRRISHLGRIYELPDVRISHFGGRTAQQGWLRIRRFLRSGFLFFSRYGWRLTE